MGALIEPYLSDVADAGAVEDRRRKIAELDAENGAIRESNAKREGALKKGGKKAKDAPAYRHEKMRLVFARMQLERHDGAIRSLARYLRGVDLHVVNPTLMSASEEAAGDAANAQVYAYYQQVRASGRRHAAAVEATAWKFGISEGEVERIIEFRDDVKLVTCAEPDCDREVFRQNLCSMHYQRALKARKRRAERAEAPSP